MSSKHVRYYQHTDAIGQHSGTKIETINHKKRQENHKSK